MTDVITDVMVRVASGPGRIARRANSLLFDPSGENAELVQAFDGAGDDEAAIVAVKRHLIDVDFELAPVVVVDWRAGALGLLVFGDADVHSSASAAPMISGAGSGTWIERTLGSLELGDSDEADVWCGADTDDTSDLRSGVVPCGGFRLTARRTDAANLPEPASNGRSVIDQYTFGSDDVESNGQDETEWPDTQPQPSLPPSPPEPPVAEEPVPVPAPAPDAAVKTGDLFAPPTRSEPPEAPLLENSLTEPLSRPTVEEPPLESAGVGLVEATVCSNGHANPVGLATCRMCAVDIPVEVVPELVSQPSVGHFRFSDGSVIEVATPQVIGRKPVTELDGAVAVVIEHAEVSRSHLEVAIDGWSVLITDMGSRNGTWVVPPADPTPIRLGAQVPYLLEHGTIVHLGSPDASFTYDFGTD